MMQLRSRRADGPTFEAGHCLSRTSGDAHDLAAAWPEWTVDIMQVLPGTGVSSLAIAQSGRMQLSHVVLGRCFRLKGQIPEGCVALVLAHSDRPFICSGRLLGRCDVGLLTVDDDVDLSSNGRTDLLIVTMEENAFDAIARATTRHWASSLVRGHLRLADARSRGRLEHDLRLKLIGALRLPGVLADGAISDVWEQQVLKSILDRSTRSESCPELPQRLRQAGLAESYLRRRVLAPVSMPELAAAAGASERAMHQGFIERFGVSPSAYLKALRLNGVRRDLHFAPSGVTVTETALRWGFTHLGRFAGHYRAFFDEMPSDTLCRALLGNRFSAFESTHFTSRVRLQ